LQAGGGDTAGIGGAILLLPGDGGGAEGGALTGFGGAGDSGTRGGDIRFTTGAGGDAGDQGGDFVFLVGQGNLSGASGNFFINTETGAGATGGFVEASESPGLVSIYGVTFDGAGDGGDVALWGGLATGGATGDGGVIRITGGQSDATNGSGGDVLLSGGAGNGSGADGEVVVTGALTATSYGGIAEADLLSRSVDETVTGAWVFKPGDLQVINADDDVFIDLNVDDDAADRAILTISGGLAQTNFFETGRSADEGGWMLLANNTDIGFWTTTDAAPNSAVTQGLVIERTTGTAIAGVVTQGNFIMEGQQTRNIMRSIRLQLSPGDTPATNITIAHTSATQGRGFNAPTITDGVDLEKSGTEGSFSLDSGGTTITLNITENITNIISCHITGLHNLNNSSAVAGDIWHLNSTIVSSNLDLSLVQVGQSSSEDLTTILAAGDRVDLQCVFITDT
jgi:hypothetical protein